MNYNFWFNLLFQSSMKKYLSSISYRFSTVTGLLMTSLAPAFKQFDMLLYELFAVWKTMEQSSLSGN